MVSPYHALAVMASFLPRSLLQCMKPEQHILPSSSSSRQPIFPTSTLLNIFQVAKPVLTPSGPDNKYGCVFNKILMEHDFAFSYGRPFVGEYAPPPCNFNRVNINLTVTSHGRQFDRLGIMYLGDVEVFRTSTAEPTADGIIWTYMKDMQHLNALWNIEGILIFDLGNLVDDTYTGIFHTVLTATFFTVPNSPPTADTILPISALMAAKGRGSAFILPGRNASISHTLPRNVRRALVTLSACGQSTEEFWYTNSPDSHRDTFANSTGTLYGGSPWREVQFLIDGQLAGVSWPFPVIFTGGIVPGLWRPIVGIDAFDLREREIDISPWLPLILDGNSHSFEIRVARLNDDGAGQVSLIDTPDSHWVVSGKLFLFLDIPEFVTTGILPTVDAPPPTFDLSHSTSQNSTGANETLTYSLSAFRRISITSTLFTSTGPVPVSWSQELSYMSHNALTCQGLTQFTNQVTRGFDRAASEYANSYVYPLTVNSSYAVSPTSLSITASLSHGLSSNVSGSSITPSLITPFDTSAMVATFPPSPSQFVLHDGNPFDSHALLSTVQNGSASYYASRNGSYSFGTTEQVFSSGKVSHSGSIHELYERHVKAVNATVVEDEEKTGEVELVAKMGPPKGVALDSKGNIMSVRRMLGRGPD